MQRKSELKDCLNAGDNVVFFSVQAPIHGGFQGGADASRRMPVEKELRKHGMSAESSWWLRRDPSFLETGPASQEKEDCGCLPLVTNPVMFEAFVRSHNSLVCKLSFQPSLFAHVFAIADALIQLLYLQNDPHESEKGLD